MKDDHAHQADTANAPDWDAIARYLANESSAEEATRVRQWLDANPTDKALFEQLSSGEALSVLAAPADVDVEAALGRVHAQMEQQPGLPRLTLERGGRRGRRIAPVLVFLAAAAAVIGFVTLRPSGKAPSTNSPAARTYATRTGQRDSIMLADGSRVILGPDSRLTVPAGYGTDARAIELEGDGYFDVRHDASKPFTVRVANALVEDIGTTFTVESDAGDTTSVSVLSGSVRLRAQGSSAAAGAILAAGDRGSLTVDGQVHAYPNTVRNDDASWTTGRIVFHDASVTRIVAEIHRWYGVKLRVADTTILNRHVTTTFDDGDSIDQVLRSLALTLGARIDRQGDSATIHPSSGPATVR